MRERKVRMGDLKHALRIATAASPQDRGAILISGGADLAGAALIVVVRLVPLGIFVVTTF